MVERLPAIRQHQLIPVSQWACYQTTRTGALELAVLGCMLMLLLQGQQSHHTSPPGQQHHTQDSHNWRVSSAASLSDGTLSHAGDSMGNGLNLMGEVPMDEQPSRILYVSGIAAEVSDEELCRMFEVCLECSCCLVGPWGPCAGRAAIIGASGGEQPRSCWCCG